MIVNDYTKRGVYMGHKWEPVLFPSEVDVTDPYVLDRVLAQLRDEIDDLGKQVVQLKNEMEDGR